MLILPPARRPCPTCPYLLSCPSGIWGWSEYEHLMMFDRDRPDQPLYPLGCHQDDGRVCAGWASCHGNHESLGLRVALVSGAITAETYQQILDYVSPVPVFTSGREAAAHGMADIQKPSLKARLALAKLRRHRGGSLIAADPREPGKPVRTAQSNLFERLQSVPCGARRSPQSVVRCDKPALHQFGCLGLSQSGLYHGGSGAKGKRYYWRDKPTQGSS